MKWCATQVAVAAIVVHLGLATTVRADLIGYWPFDEVIEVDGSPGTPDVAPTEGPHNGLLVGDARISDDPLGERGKVLDLGDFNNGAGVNLPTFAQNEDSELGIIDGLGPGFSAIVESQEVTISYWMNRRGDDSTNQWTFLFNAPTGRQLGSHAPWSNGQVYFDVSGCCGANQRINAPMGPDGSAATDGEWHHLAYVKKKNPEESDKAVTAIFLDGQALVSSPGCDLICWDEGASDIDWSAATIEDVVPITQAGIGSQFNGGDSNNGYMDDFAIWEEALSVDRIVGLSQGGEVTPIPCGCLIPDFNGDGNIDIADFMIIADNFNASFALEEAFFKGDMNGDLRVDLRDFLLFRELFQAISADAAISTVPETRTGVLLSVGALFLLALRGRR